MSLLSEILNCNTSIKSENIFDQNVNCYDSEETSKTAQKNAEYDSGIFGNNSNFSSVCETETQLNQNYKEKANLEDCKCLPETFIIRELKKKIVQINLELSKSNQENSTLKTDLKFRKNQLDYFKNCADWYKKKCIGFKNDTSKLRREHLEKEIDLTKSKSLVRNLKGENKKWLQKIDLIKLESANKYKLLTSKLETLESKLKSDEIHSKGVVEDFVSSNNNLAIELKSSKWEVDGLKNILESYVKNFEGLKNEVSELQLKNSNLENILGRKSKEIEKLQNGNLENTDEHLPKKKYEQNISKYLTLDLKNCELHIRNEELNKIIQLKDIEMKDKIRRYETAIRTLLGKVKEYRFSKNVFLKKSDQLSVDQINLKIKFENAISEKAATNKNLLIMSAIIDNLKKNNFKLRSELCDYKKFVDILKDRTAYGDIRKFGCRKIDCKSIDLLIGKSNNLDKIIYRKSFKGEIKLEKGQARSSKH